MSKDGGNRFMRRKLCKGSKERRKVREINV